MWTARCLPLPLRLDGMAGPYSATRSAHMHKRRPHIRARDKTTERGTCITFTRPHTQHCKYMLGHAFIAAMCVSVLIDEAHVDLIIF